MAGQGKLMNPRMTLKIYPRPDTFYRGKSSLNFDAMRSKILLDRSNQGELYLWIAHIFCGVFVALLTFLLMTCEDKLIEFRTHFLQNLIDRHENSIAYIWYAGSALFLVTIAVLLTVYVGPGATGSGVVEVMGLLNGVNYPDAIGFKTLFVKVVGLIFAISSGLCIGKEGPLVHIGAILGVITCYLPFRSFKYLQNDVYKRLFISLV